MSGDSQDSAQRITLFSDGKVDTATIARATLVAGGVSLHLLPSSESWFILVYVAVLAASAWLSMRSLPYPTLIVIFLVGLSIFGLTGVISLEHAGAFAAAIVLLLSDRRHLPEAVVILLLPMSMTMSAEAFLVESLPYVWAQLLAPVLIVTLLLFLARPGRFLVNVVALICAAATAYAGHALNVGPAAEMAFVALPTILFASLLGVWRDVLKPAPIVALLLVASASFSTWAFDPPRSPTAIVFLLPDDQDAFEHQYFTQYEGALEFVGVRAKQVIALEEIPEGALVLLPWLNSSIMKEDEWRKFATAARKHSWIVVAAGEHTNYQDVAERMNSLTDGLALRRDTTVPPGNTNKAGYLRSPHLVPFPFDAILNRGASVAVRHPLSRVLLSGDGWFSDPDLGEWLWVGDFQLEPGERRGRLTLAASYSDGARWIFIGDNSFLINRQIIADPRPMLQILALASLWNVFVADAFILILIGLVSLASITLARLALGGSAVVIVVAVGASAFGLTPPSEQWKGTYIGEDGFDERNFNVALLSLIERDVTSKTRIFRHPGPLSESGIGKSGKPEMHFGHVDGELRIGEVRLFDCWRLGAIDTPQGPRLMDAQACKTEGPADILIGTQSSAAAIRVQANGTQMLIILDTAFLSNAASGTKNVDWLIRQAMSARGK